MTWRWPRLGRLRPAGPAVAPEARAFQEDLDALVAEPAPWVLRAWPFMAGALILGLVGVAAITRIDIVVTAQGRLTPDAPPMVLSPIDRAVLRDLRVRVGEAVVAGQVVAVLDSTFTAADRAALAAQSRALTAERDRLEAEMADGWLSPAAEGDEAVLQGRLLHERAAFYAARVGALAARLRALETALAAERAAGDGVERQLAIAREIEEMRGRLAAAEVGSHLNVLVAQASRIEAEAARTRHGARLAELTEEVAAARAEREAFERDWERLQLEQLARVRGDLARLDEQMAKAMRLDALTEMRAPADGVVLETARRAPGSLVREGEAVVTLVPSDVPMIAEIALKSADIGRLVPGAAATIKVDSFPWRQHGMLAGRLRAVGRDSYPGEGGTAALHRGHIVLDPGGPGGLVPGMTLSAEIKVGSRSVLEFFLEPLMRGLSESLREP